jgi:hypothetical protein
LIAYPFAVRRLIGGVAVVSQWCLWQFLLLWWAHVAAPAQTLAVPGASESTMVPIEATRLADTRYDIRVVGNVAANGTIDTSSPRDSGNSC